MHSEWGCTHKVGQCMGLSSCFQQMNEWYGFKESCTWLFGYNQGNQVYEIVNSVFNVLPLAAVIDGNIFCAHGGIPRLPQGPDDRMAILLDTNAWHKFRQADQRALLQVCGLHTVMLVCPHALGPGMY